MQLIVFLLTLSLMVILHELGHFLAARLFRMKIEEFGLGLPPRVLGLFRHKETLFSLNAIPLGGFVKIMGEDGVMPDGMQTKDAFFEKPIWQRAVVLFSGVAMNFLLGVFLFSVVYSFLGIPTQTDKVILAEVAEKSPAYEAGLRGGERVLTIEYNEEVTKVSDISDFIGKIDGLKGREVGLVIERNGKQEKIMLTPRVSPPEGQGSLGVVLTNVEMMRYPWWMMAYKGVWVGLNEAWGWGREILAGLSRLVMDLVGGRGVDKGVSGPIGIYQISKEVYKTGPLAVMQFAGILSINLAILNTMPFPALDGGRVVMLALEKLIGKRRKLRVESAVNTIGMVLLLGFMFFVSIRDILNLF